MTKPTNPESLPLDGAWTVLRKQMHQFATLQLRDAQLAEDAVQEALEAALKGHADFENRATLKTWVFAILKNKIADLLRQNQRLVRLLDHAPAPEEEDETTDDVLDYFDRRGLWNAMTRPKPWKTPQSSLQDRQFWAVFEVCLERLPERQARVFLMREYVGLDSQEICEVVGITVSNLHVLLHRARLQLRACLEQRWFMEGDRHEEL